MSEKTNNYGIVKATAFWGVIISGIANIIAFVIQLLVKVGVIDGAGKLIGSVMSVMNVIASIALLISVLLAAYAHSTTKKKVWRVLFWIFAILAILGIFGFNIMSVLN